MPSFLDLPQEIQAAILGRLDTLHRLQTLPLVCRRLRALMERSSPAWQLLSLRLCWAKGRAATGRFSNLHRRLLRIGGETQSLELFLGSKCYSGWRAFSLPTLLGALPRLRTLVLVRAWQGTGRGWQGTVDEPALSPSDFQGLGAWCPHLQDLTIDSLGAAAWHTPQAFEHLAAMGLTRLALHMKELGDTAVRCLPLLTSLVELHIVPPCWEYLVKTGGAPGEQGFSGLRIWSSLTSLTALRIEGYVHAAGLPPHLVRLRVRVPSPSDIAALHSLPSLELLELTVSKAAMAEGAWPSLSRLTALSLEDCDHQVRSTDGLPRGSVRLPRLRFLDLSHETFYFLLDWSSLPSLEVARLEYTYVQGARVDLPQLTCLQALTLDGLLGGGHPASLPVSLVCLALGLRQRLPETVAELPRLKILHLRPVWSQEAEEATLATLSGMTTLRELHVCLWAEYGDAAPRLQQALLDALPNVREARCHVATEFGQSALVDDWAARHMRMGGFQSTWWFYQDARHRLAERLAEQS